jgi:Carboxypeptidase regulatory-like domain
MVTSLLLLLYIISVSADPQSKITGQVTDSEGAALANSRVLVHWDSSGSTVDLADNIGSKEDVIVVTDASGNYSVSVPPGFYDLFVSAMAFTPTAAKVRVKQGQRMTFNAKL